MGRVVAHHRPPAGGLGRALAIACAAHGATVVLHGRVVRKLEALYDEIVAPRPSESLSICHSTSRRRRPRDFANVAESATGKSGRVDAVIHTAVMLGALGPIEHQAFDPVARPRCGSTCSPPFGLTRALFPLLHAAPDGSVVLTLDTRGQAPKAYWGAYAVAKAGLSALLSILADEWEGLPNLRINGVVPGPMRSPLRAQTHPGDDITRLPPPEMFVPSIFISSTASRKPRAAA